MEKRTFESPDIRFDSEIEFCSPSWRRKRKYVSWNHWFVTKSKLGKGSKDRKNLRFKLFEMGHYAGAVILEVGLKHQSHATVAVRAANDAALNPQYYAVESDSSAIVSAQSKFRKKRLEEHALFFQGSLQEFRSLLPVSPTMVILNERENVVGLLSHLSLFLAPGTPVLVQNWYQARGGDDSFQGHNAFEICGRFGESVFLVVKAENEESSIGFCRTEFARLRKELCVASDGKLIQQKSAVANILPQRMVTVSDKKWPFKRDQTEYPDTLPDGKPWPKISIVTPTYNQGKYIEETINSVLNQSYGNLEYIVIDGGSTDETPEVLDRYADSIDHLISEPDEGQSDAINKGMALATGEIVTWLNSDDVLTPGTLYAMAMAFWKSKADMVVGTVQFLQDGAIVGEHLTSCENGPLQLSELLDLDNNWLQGRFFFQPELMFTRDLWQRAGGYVDKKLYYSMDHELWLRFAIAGANVHVIGRPTVMYRVHDEQKTHDDYQPELRTVNRRYLEKYGSVAPTHVTLKHRKYKTLFVNDVGVRYGAGIAHGRLQEMMDAAGHETVFVSAKFEGEPHIKTEGELYCEIEKESPDLVVFGNLHNANLGVGLVDMVSERWPTCFVMHDLWLATGRCCYLGGCDKYKSNCDSSCPTTNEYPVMNREQVESAFESKLNIISKPRKTVVMANSDWTKQVAESSAITSKGVLKTLKYGFPLHIFKRRDKNLCREVLGLPEDAFIILFASVNVAEERKGLRHLFEALNRLQLDNLLPVCIGHAVDAGDLYPGTIALGYVDDPWKNAMIYSAADVFVGPSLQEAFGQVFIEAAACGTPSIGYPVGGVQEAIVHGVSGQIAQAVHPSALADEIENLFRDHEYRKKLSVWGRIEVENEWSYRSAYHHFNNLLRQVPEQIGFLPPTNIAFDPAKTAGVSSQAGPSFGILEKAETSISPYVGFADEESLVLSDGTSRQVRWAIGNVAQLKICLSGNQRRNLILECMSPVLNQVVKVFCDGVEIGERAIDTKDDFFTPIRLCLIPDVVPGEHQVRLEFSGTVKEQGGSRDLAILVSNLSLDPLETGQLTSRAA